MGALIRTANQFQNSDFPTPRGYEQAVHPPFNIPSRERDPLAESVDLKHYRLPVVGKFYTVELQTVN
jgi:hypothetical protein